MSIPQTMMELRSTIRHGATEEEVVSPPLKDETLMPRRKKNEEQNGTTVSH